jgi:DNA-cytosine methyltransferase
MNPTFGSLFAGVGGFDLGFEQAGFDCKFQVEWDDNCQQTLAHHWPNVPRWGDVSEVNGADLPPVDVITYGFPCQDLSVAGKRAGLDGERSNLFFEAVRIIQEMRQATNGLYPTFAVAENVAGLLNADKGDAMARVLDTLAEAGALVIEWCLLDAQWFGVPQRRRRVFVTACFDPATADRCPDQIFPVAKSGARNPKEIEQERQETARASTDSVGERGLQRVTGTVAAGAHPGSYNGQDAYNDMLIPFVKSTRVQSADTPETWIDEAPNPTLNSFDVGDIRTTTAIVFEPKSMLEENWASAEAKNSLRAGESKSAHVVVHDAVMVAQETTHDVIGTLQERAYKGPNHENARDGQLIVQHDAVPTLRSGGDGGIPSSRGEHVIAFDSTFGAQSNTFDNLSPPVKVGSSAGIPSPPAVAQPNLAVRRLTPLECERLMGWPDDHTLHRTDGKTNSDSTRYRMCGNGVATPVATWLAKHLHPLL